MTQPADLDTDGASDAGRATKTSTLLADGRELIYFDEAPDETARAQIPATWIPPRPSRRSAMTPWSTSGW